MTETGTEQDPRAARFTPEVLAELEATVSRLAQATFPLQGTDRGEVRLAVDALLAALEAGAVRAARRTDDGWEAVPWVKQGILLAFKAGETREFRPYAFHKNPDFGGSSFHFADRDTLPLRDGYGPREGVRIVPGGSSVRAGAYLGRGVVIMPPAYVNVGAWVGEDALVDSHALVGSCAQVGARVHLSAGAQLGGVLEPIGLRPVVIEDDVLVGGNTGVFEGTLVGEGAVLAPGVQLTASTTVYDLVENETYRATPERPLAIPPGAVVVPGTRPGKGAVAEKYGIGLYVPVIVKYRDEKTDAATALEEALR
ncbi:MAG TPA: 2,3,4,5-tetrahydropyridine-2,6-dicarboxylate N-succinyltransferase [Longimicrobiales bacterium]|nr:2,3,4,5-tetrahydropyridine-2,6-dicarboxylate N-succinyltransferase [Longimicrobiales bacterium]